MHGLLNLQEADVGIVVEAAVATQGALFVGVDFVEEHLAYVVHRVRVKSEAQGAWLLLRHAVEPQALANAGQHIGVRESRLVATTHHGVDGGGRKVHGAATLAVDGEVQVAHADVLGHLVAAGNADVLRQHPLHAGDGHAVLKLALQRDAYHDVGAHAFGHVNGIVVHQSAIGQRHAMQLHGRQYAGHGHAGTHHLGQHATVKVDLRAIDQISGHAGKAHGQGVEGDAVVIAHGEFGQFVAQVAPFHPAPQFRFAGFCETEVEHIALGAGSLLGRQGGAGGTVGHEEVPIAVAHERVELLHRVAHGIERPDVGAHAGAHHHVDGYALLLQGIEHTNVRCTLGTATTQHECHLLTAHTVGRSRERGGSNQAWHDQKQEQERIPVQHRGWMQKAEAI